MIALMIFSHLAFRAQDSSEFTNFTLLNITIIWEFDLDNIQKCLYPNKSHITKERVKRLSCFIIRVRVRKSWNQESSQGEKKDNVRIILKLLNTGKGTWCCKDNQTFNACGFISSNMLQPSSLFCNKLYSNMQKKNKTKYVHQCFFQRPFSHQLDSNNLKDDKLT